MISDQPLESLLEASGKSAEIDKLADFDKATAIHVSASADASLFAIYNVSSVPLIAGIFLYFTQR
jgi:hypothetical protein